MKKQFCLLLAVHMQLCLLAGCHAGDITGTTGPTGETTQSTTEITVPDESTEALEVGLPMPENPVGTWAEYDPDREYYILTGGVDKTVYAEEKTVFEFVVMSRRKVNPWDISVWVNTRNGLGVGVGECNIDFRGTEYNQESGMDYLPFYVFQHYDGVDFALAGQLYDWYLNPPEAGSAEAAEMEAITGGEDVKQYFDRYVNQGMDTFAALVPKDTREFYLCNVWVHIDLIDDEETLTKMEVTIEGETFNVEFGTLRLLLSEAPVQYPSGADDDWRNVTNPLEHRGTTLYSDGTTQNVILYEAAAGKDMFLEELNILSEGYEVLDLSTQITSGDEIATTQWDGKSPLRLHEGDTVRIVGVIRNETFSNLSYYTTMHHELVYSVDGEKFSTHQEVLFEPNLNYHEVYAMIFDGVDMRPYYEDYYYRVYDQWRKEYQ